MQEPYVIMTQGFRNVVDTGGISGFQVKVRIPYYRGVYLSAVDSLTLQVDDKPIPADQISIEVAGKQFTLAQMQESDTRWEFVEPATLQIKQAGGLKPGLHVVQVGIAIRKSYFGPEDPEHLYDFFGLWQNGKYTPFLEAPTVVRKSMTLVQ